MTLDHLWHRYDFINDLSLRHFDKLLSNGDYRHVAVLVYWDVDVIVNILNLLLLQHRRNVALH